VLNHAGAFNGHHAWWSAELACELAMRLVTLYNWIHRD
jgi:hypothetical protein